MDQPTNASAPGISNDKMLYHSSHNSRLRRMKKVRVACERCRYRRIKCDGQVPACSNCTKSGSICIDVDSHNADRRVSRGFMENSFARIAWLEDVIRAELPHVNLGGAPNLIIRQPEITSSNGDTESAKQLYNLAEHTPNSSISDILYDNVPTPKENSFAQAAQNVGAKQPAAITHGPSSRESSVEQDTRSVALDLGLLSLNSDSRQLHYVGSSSGSLFASLVQAGSSRSRLQTTTSPYEVDSSIGQAVDSDSSLSSTGPGNGNISRVYELLRNDLPPRNDCDALCRQFFLQLQPNHPFLHRPSFYKMVDALYFCASIESFSSLQHNGWPATLQGFDFNGEQHIVHGRKSIPIPIDVATFQLFLVLSIGANLQIRRRLYHHNPEIFFRYAMALADRVLSIISLPSLQSTLLLLVHSLVVPGGIDLWTTTRLAMAHCVDLGLHRELGERMKFSRVAVEMRRRIFFSVYSLDRSISTVQGRPFSIGDDFWDVNLPSTTRAEITLTSSNAPSGISDDFEIMSYSVHLFKMSQIVSNIKVVFYRLSKPQGGTPWPENLLTLQSQVRNDLERWASDIPSAVVVAPAELKLRLSIKLRIHYHAAMCLLHQSSQAIVQPSDQALQICYDNAAERLKLYETLYETGNLVHSWRTVHDIFLAGATVMYCVWISKAVRDTVSLSVLASLCRRCSSLLSVAGEWWPALRKSKASLERLASHTIEMFAEDSMSSAISNKFATSNRSHANETNVPQPSDLLPENIEEALASVLNHDHGGQLSNIFDTAPGMGMSFGLNSPTEAADEYSDDFWADLGGYVSNDVFG